MKKRLLILISLLSTLPVCAQWTVNCSGSSDNNGFIVDLEYFEDELYATGLFTRLCGANTGYLGKLEGDDWVAAGVVPHEGHALEVIDDALYVAVYQFNSDSNYVIRYNGAVTTALGAGVFCSGGDPFATPSIYDIIDYNDQLIASGDFNRVGNKDISGIMRWTGTEWDSLGSGLSGSLPGAPPIIYAHNMHVFEDNLYVAGNFSTAGSKTVNGIARWDGSDWWELSDGFNKAAYCVGSFAGSLYAGGEFSASGSTGLNAFARWNGSSWESPGFGFSSASGSDFTFVHTLKVFDDKLFILGGFDQLIKDDGTIIPCGSVVAWDGDSIYTFDGGVGDKDLEAIEVNPDGYFFGGGLYGEGYLAAWTEPTPVQINHPNSGFQLYPNPADDWLYLDTNEMPSANFRILDYNGKVMDSGTYSGIPLNISHLPQGLYIIELLTPSDLPFREIFQKL